MKDLGALECGINESVVWLKEHRPNAEKEHGDTHQDATRSIQRALGEEIGGGITPNPQ
jgi:hypothetical protein